MRNRLMKKVAENYTYKFESPWFVYVEAVGDGDIQEELFDTLSPADVLTNEDEGDAVRTFNEAWDSEAIGIIEEHITERTGVDVRFSIELADKVYATVMADEELNDKQINEIIDELIGQYADGVGEGLEQRAFIKFDDDVAGEEADWMGSNDFSKYASDHISFEEWCEIQGYDIPEDDTPESDELYAEYDDAEIDITFHVEYFIKMWRSENFNIKLVK